MQLRWFPIKTLSFWTSTLTILGLFSPSKKLRTVTGYAGLICGLGGAGVVYERIAEREGIAREPVQIGRNATPEDLYSLLLHLVFGAIGLAGIIKALGTQTAPLDSLTPLG